MFEFIFVDLPLALIGYGVVVLLIMKFREAQTDYADELPLGFDSTPSGTIVSHSAVRSDEIKKSESIISAPSQQAEQAPAYEDLPSDSQLRRHFITNLFTIATDIHSQPEESTLKRHHEQLVLSLVQQMLENPSRRDELRDLAIDISATAKQKHLPSTLSSGTSALVDELDQKQNQVEGVMIPEDSVLRRHFIQGIVTEIELSHPRPTDHTLTRHYDQWIAYRLEELIQQG